MVSLSLATMAGGGSGKEFLGFPIPAAAGLVSSLTLLVIQMNEKERSLGNWNYMLGAVLVMLSVMMVSTVKYPSFKSLGFRSRSTFLKTMLGALMVGSLVIFREKLLYYVLPATFTLYLLWGFARTRVSRKLRDDVEEDEDDNDDEGEGTPAGRS